MVVSSSSLRWYGLSLVAEGRGCQARYRHGATLLSYLGARRWSEVEREGWWEEMWSEGEESRRDGCGETKVAAEPGSMPDTK